MTRTIDVAISGRSVPRLPRREIGRFVKRSLRALRITGVVPRTISEVSIAFVDDETMRRLNRQFRGKDTTTDVLTFDLDASDAPPDAPGKPLGEILISIDQARRQAIQQRHSLATEVRYLILHGLIHALGFDHETDDGEMDEIETSIRPQVDLV